ncbi:IS30 family transposase, partial [Mycoplasmopsis synoviae]
YNWINSKNWKINRKNLLRSNYVFGGKKQKSVQERLVRKRWVRLFKIGLRKEFDKWEANLIKDKRVTKVHLLVIQEKFTKFVFIKKIMTKNLWNI